MCCTVQGSNPDKGKRFFSLPKHIDRQWSPSTLLFNAYRRSFRGRGMLLTTHLHLAPTLRMCGAIPLVPLYALMAWTRTNLLLPYPCSNLGRDQPFCITVSSSFSGQMPVQYLKLARDRFLLHPLRFIHR